MTFSVEGRVAVVTGAGRGIGAAVALALAEAGADVVVASRTLRELDAVAAQIGALGRKAHVVVADLSDLDAVAGLADAAIEGLGRLDIVVNNLGGSEPAAFRETSPADLALAFHANVLTAHALTSAAVPAMLRSGAGSVVNIASSLGHTVGRGYVAYATAKAALLHYTRLAAEDLAPLIRVNAISPGTILTPALEGFAHDPNFRGAMRQNIPLRRIGSVAEVAAAAVYLASPASGYTTGASLNVDGGQQRAVVDLPIPDLEPSDG